MESTRTTRSRKRQKVSHADDNTEDTSALPSKSTNKATTAPPDKMESAQAVNGGKELGVLEEDLDSMRHLISCKICQRFLTEPYGLACGHTYCYICLDSWLVTQRKNTCPECRTEVKQQPVPSLIIREMVNIFSTKQELLSEGESMAELKNNADEAALKVASDKANISEGGLFKGMFNGMGRLREAFYDAEDNVHRCPICGHEIEDGMCSGCGLPMGDGTGAWTDHEEAEFDDFEGGYETEDIFPQFSTRIMGENALRSRRGPSRHHRAIQSETLRRVQEMLDEDEDSDVGSYDTDEPDLEGFVVPDDDLESRGQEDDSPEVQSRGRQRRGHLPTRSTRSNNANRPIVLSDSDSDSDDTSIATMERPARRREPIPFLATDTPSTQNSESSDSSPLSSDTSSSDEEEAPIPRGRQVRKPRHGVLIPPSRTAVSYETTSDSESRSDSESSEDSDEDDEDDSQLSSDGDSDTDSNSDSDASDSTATATHSGHPYDDARHNAVLAASLRLHEIQSEALSQHTSEDDDDY